jgi:hypothetical protein
MRIKVELDKGETLLDAEEFMEKALKAKSECDHGERYADDAMNKAHDLICQRFDDMMQEITNSIKGVAEDVFRTKISG